MPKKLVQNIQKHGKCFVRPAYAGYIKGKVGGGMSCRFTSLKCKEVVNVCDGCRLGFVADVEVDVKCGQVVAIIVPGPGKALGLFGRTEDFVIPWACIRQIGDDIILIEGDLERFRCARRKKALF